MSSVDREGEPGPTVPGTRDERCEVETGTLVVRLQAACGALDEPPTTGVCCWRNRIARDAEGSDSEGMEFFCYHRDRPGSTPLRTQMVEEHWTYMDLFAETMIARGPTFTGDDTMTGSVHILDLPDAAAARAFAFEEPGYQAGAYRDVLLRRWHNTLGRTMWDFSVDRPDDNRYLVLGFSEPATDSPELPRGDELIACGPLLSDDGATVVGAAVLLEASSAHAAQEILSADHFTGVEVHQWEFGGRPT